MHPLSERDIAEQIFDVVVVGGGVNGTASLRELARAGYRTLLVEADDLASGASGRSSRMLHCGLRYLETENPILDALRHPGRFFKALGMAGDAMKARAELADDDTVATRAIELGFPVWESGPFPLWQLSGGLKLLEFVGPGNPPLDRARLNAEETRRHPIGRHLRDPGKLKGMVTFREYLFESPERLCVDNAMDAEAHGAELVLKTRAEIRERDNEGLWRVALDGPRGTREVRARVVLNMAGSWADGLGHFKKRLIQGTKGAHIIVRLPEGFADRGVATLHRGGHPFYGLPMGENRFYFGPTETLFEGDARRVRADADDVEFLLAEANHLLPGLGLKRSDIEQTWAGVRPLTHDPERPMGARERTVHDLAPQGFGNVLAMTGGPVMSSRGAGRLMLTEVGKRLGAPPPVSRDIHTSSANAGRDPAVLAVTHEHAPDLYGVLAQRTGAVWRGRLERAEAERAARKVASHFGWDDTRTEQEIDAFLVRQDTSFQVPSAFEDNPDEPGENQNNLSDWRTK